VFPVTPVAKVPLTPMETVEMSVLLSRSFTRRGETSLFTRVKVKSEMEAGPTTPVVGLYGRLTPNEKLEIAPPALIEQEAAAAAVSFYEVESIQKNVVTCAKPAEEPNSRQAAMSHRAHPGNAGKRFIILDKSSRPGKTVTRQKSVP